MSTIHLVYIHIFHRDDVIESVPQSKMFYKNKVVMVFPLNEVQKSLICWRDGRYKTLLLEIITAPWSLALRIPSSKMSGLSFHIWI